MHGGRTFRALAAAFLTVPCLLSAAPGAWAATGSYKTTARCDLPGDYRDYTVSVTWAVRASDGKVQPDAFAFSVRTSDTGRTFLVYGMSAGVYWGEGREEEWNKAFPGVTTGSMNAGDPDGDDPVFRPRGNTQRVLIALRDAGGSFRCVAWVSSA